MVRRNTYAKLAELYGIEFTNPFRVYSAYENETEVFSWGLLNENGFVFTENETLDENTSWLEDSEMVVRILSGDVVVVSDYCPKDGEVYYFIQNKNGAVRKTVFNNDETLDALNLKNDNYFKTLELAESQKALVVKRIFGVELEDDPSGCLCGDNCTCKPSTGGDNNGDNGDNSGTEPIDPTKPNVPEPPVE